MSWDNLYMLVAFLPLLLLPLFLFLPPSASVAYFWFLLSFGVIRSKTQDWFSGSNCSSSIIVNKPGTCLQASQSPFPLSHRHTHTDVLLLPREAGTETGHFVIFSLKTTTVTFLQFNNSYKRQHLLMRKNTRYWYKQIGLQIQNLNPPISGNSYLFCSEVLVDFSRKN